MSQGAAFAELDIRLDRSSSVPLYHQLATSIEQAITSGELAPGDRLENELSLTTRLGLSRPTARQAIQELVKKGLLVRKRGVGTQVVRSQFRRDERLSSLNEDLAKAGRVPSTRLLDFTVGPLADDVRDALDASGVTEGDFVTIRRLRLADDVPLAILTNYLPPASRSPATDVENGRSLYGHLRDPRRQPQDRPPAHLRAPDDDEEAGLLGSDDPGGLPHRRADRVRRRRPVRRARPARLPGRALLDPVSPRRLRRRYRPPDVPPSGTGRDALEQVVLGARARRSPGTGRAGGPRRCRRRRAGRAGRPPPVR